MKQRLLFKITLLFNLLVTLIFLNGCSKGSVSKTTITPPVTITTPSFDPSALRGVWITTTASTALNSKENIKQTVTNCKIAGINNLFVVVYNNARTTYPSQVMQNLLGVSILETFSGRDPLKEIIDEGHAAGLKVHAWFEYGFASSYGQNGGAIIKAKPNWAAKDINGALVSKNNFEWLNAFDPEVQMFLPVVVETDEKGLFAGFTNEATFAANFSQEMGILTNDTLQEYQNFQTAGSVFKKSIIEDFGGFKSSIKLTFVYEFLLRLTHNNVKIMTVPRVGYQHLNFREDSLFWSYKNDDKIKLSENETKFWLETAKKEFFFKNKRDVNYEIA